MAVASGTTADQHRFHRPRLSPEERGAFDNCPQLPPGDASMLLIACSPPLCFQIMNPLVVSHYDGDLTRANLLPSRRDAVMRRWMTRPTYKKSDATTPTTSAAATANSECCCAGRCQPPPVPELRRATQGRLPAVVGSRRRRVSANRSLSASGTPALPGRAIHKFSDTDADRRRGCHRTH